MITEVLNLIRTMPGPLKKPRIIFADLTEEIIDIARAYYLDSIAGTLESDSSKEERPAEKPSAAPATKIDDAPTVKIKTPPKRKKPAATRAKAVPAPAQAQAARSVKTGELKPQPELVPLFSDPKVMRKQDFKVLAILWDAAKRDAGLMSAKEAAEYGERIGIEIRHENIRKVIRTRLSKEVETHKARSSTGNATIFRYRLSPGGIEHFENTYIQQSE